MRTELLDKTIGILFGGDTLEGQVSAFTAQAVSGSLTSQGFNVVDIDIGNSDFLSIIVSVDIVFNCLHGEMGEDGKIHGLLDVLKKSYTGSGVFANALCRDKVKFKDFVKSKGFLTPDYLTIRETIDFNHLERTMIFPLVIKPRQSGGGIGIQKLESFTQGLRLLEGKYGFNNYFIEEFIEGKILTVGIIEINGEIICSPAIEIVLPEGNDIYDYNIKIDSKADFEVFTHEHAEEVRKIAKALHSETYCSGMSRIDFIMQNEKIYALEINTIPSLFKGSSYRFSMEQLNIHFDELCYFILESALSRFKRKKSGKA
jgi:D-alanine-D-alanine ligase